MLIGSLLQPKMTGQSLDLHPVVILLSLLFFTMIWGAGGAFLAVPLTATFKIVFEKIPNTRPLAAALAGNLAPLTDTVGGARRGDRSRDDRSVHRRQTRRHGAGRAGGGRFGRAGRDDRRRSLGRENFEPRRCEASATHSRDGPGAEELGTDEHR